MAHEVQGQAGQASATTSAAGARDLLRGTHLRKTLRRSLLVALFLGCASLIAAYRLRSHRSGPQIRTEALPKDAQQAASGYSFTRSEGPNMVFTVRAQRTVKFEGSKGTTLEGVEVELFGRKSEQHDLLTTKSCEYNSDSGDFFCAGQVQIELSAPRAGEPSPPSSPVNTASSTASRIRHHQPIFLETSQLTYNQQHSTATTTAPVKWRYGPASGSAIGLTYETHEGWIELQRDVAADWPVKGTKGASGPSLLKLTAARLRYTKDEHHIEIAGPVHVTDGDQELTAEHAMVYLDTQNRLSGALFDGRVSVNGPSGTSSLAAQAASLQAEFDPVSSELRQLDANGSVRMESTRGSASGATKLTADCVHVRFVGGHFHPDQGWAIGNVHLTSEPEGTPHPAAITSTQSQGSLRSEALEAGEVQFAFHRAYGTLDRANTVGAGKLVLVPASAKEGRRVVTAGQFLMAFDQKGRLRDLRGLTPTSIVLEPARNAPAGTPVTDSRADNLQAKLNPASQTLESLQQSGRYLLVDGDRRATADQADYSSDERVVTLTGKPVLRDPETRMTADRFVVRLATNTAEGYGHVTSTHFGPLEESAPSHAAQVKASMSLVLGIPPVATGGKASEASADPRVLSSSNRANPGSAAQTTNVLADRVVADRASQSVHYEGHVRAWRGADVVEAPSLDIDRADHRVVAAQGVVTSDLAPANAPHNSGLADRGSDTETRPTAGTAAGGAAQPVTIRADRLEYAELGHTAVYRGHVRMEQADATLHADRLDAYFSNPAAGQPSELERAVATGSILVVEPGRRANGQRAEYFAAEGRIELSGGPPTLYDTEKGFTSGRTLTFFTRNDTLQVDGGQGSRALSKHHLSQ